MALPLPRSSSRCCRNAPISVASRSARLSLVGGFPVCSLREGEQQLARVAVGGDGVRAGLLLPGQPVGEEPLQDRGQVGHGAACRPACSSRPAARASSSGTACEVPVGGLRVDVSEPGGQQREPGLHVLAVAVPVQHGGDGEHVPQVVQPRERAARAGRRCRPPRSARRTCAGYCARPAACPGCSRGTWPPAARGTPGRGPARRRAARRSRSGAGRPAGTCRTWSRRSRSSRPEGRRRPGRGGMLRPGACRSPPAGR